MSDKIYVAKSSAKEIEWQYGKFLNVSFNAEELFKHVNEKGYLNLVISKRKEVGPYWDTHSVTINSWTPDNKKDDWFSKADF